MKTTFIGRQPLNEDVLKLWKFKYLSSHLLDIPHILNISQLDHAKVEKGFNEDNLQIEDYLKLGKFE